MGRENPLLAELMASASDRLEPAATTADDVAFWLYTSGSTGRPKGSIHIHSDLVVTAALYGVQVLGIRSEDVVFSAAKFFFAYGLGNSLTFPLFVGACAVVVAGRPTPDVVMEDVEHLGRAEPVQDLDLESVLPFLTQTFGQRFPGRNAKA